MEVPLSGSTQLWQSQSRLQTPVPRSQSFLVDSSQPSQDAVFTFSQVGLPTSTFVSQTAQDFTQNSGRLRSGCPPLDSILDGGLCKGEVLEISGPPGTPKEDLAIVLLKTAIASEDEAMFVGTTFRLSFLRLIVIYLSLYGQT